MVVQRLRIHLAMQGMWVWFLVGELRSHMPWGNLGLEPQLPIPRTATRGSVCRNDAMRIQGVATKTECSQINKYKKMKTPQGLGNFLICKEMVLPSLPCWRGCVVACSWWGQNSCYLPIRLAGGGGRWPRRISFEGFLQTSDSEISAFTRTIQRAC